MDVDLEHEPLGQGDDGRDVYLRDVWPSSAEIQETIATAIHGDMFTRSYADVFTGDDAWRALPVPDGDRFAWEPDSTYVRRASYLEGVRREPPGASSRWATRSRPTTSPRPARSVPTRPPAVTCSSTESSRATSTHTARAAAITR
jgi:aconitate hydratase